MTEQKRPLLFGIIRYFFVAMAGAYALSIVGLLALRVIVGESWQFIAYFNTILHLMLLPALVLLPAALILRRWVLCALLLPAVVAFGVWYLPYFLPKSPPSTDSPQIALLSFNTQTYSDDDIIRIIRDSGADVVAIQEIRESTAPGLAAALVDLYPHQALHPVSRSPVIGQGIFSRYPIIEDEFWVTHLGQQRTVIDFNGQPIVIHNRHSAYPFVSGGLAHRAGDVDDLLRRLERETDPVIVIGDFNVTERGTDYTRLSAHLTDAHQAAGWGFGWTFMPLAPRTTLTIARIDYVFYDSHFQALESRVWPEAGRSDHRPVYAVLEYID